MIKESLGLVAAILGHYDKRWLEASWMSWLDLEGVGFPEGLEHARKISAKTTEAPPMDVEYHKVPFWRLKGESDVGLVISRHLGTEDIEPTPYLTASFGANGPWSKIRVPATAMEHSFFSSKITIALISSNFFKSDHSYNLSTLTQYELMRFIIPSASFEVRVYKAIDISDRDAPSYTEAYSSVLHIPANCDLDQHIYEMSRNQSLLYHLKYRDGENAPIESSDVKVLRVVDLPKDVDDLSGGLSIHAAPQDFRIRGEDFDAPVPKMIDELMGNMHQSFKNDYSNSRMEWNLRARNVIKSDFISMGSVLSSFRRCGFDMTPSAQVRNRCLKLRSLSKIHDIPFERNVIVDDGDDGDDSDGRWDELYSDEGIRTTELYKHYKAQFYRNVPERLRGWPFQNDDVIRAMTKPSVAYAAQQGLGKTRFILMYIFARGGNRNLVVLEPTLVDEFISQARELGVSGEIHVIDSPEALKFSLMRRINIITYTRLWRGIGDKCRPRSEKRFVVTYNNKETVYKKRCPKKWQSYITEESSVEVPGPPCKSYAHVLRRYQFNSILADEAHKLAAGKTTNQGEAMFNLRAKHFVCTTGTIIRSYVRQIYPILCRTLGESTIYNEYGYRYAAMSVDGDGLVAATRKFSSLFINADQKSEQFEDTLAKGMRSRERPHVNADAIEEWHGMTSRFIIRRRRIEPGVAEFVKVPDGELSEVYSGMDKTHASVYRWWLDSFASWFEDALEKERIESIPVNSAEVLVQLTKLRLVSTIPQHKSAQIPGVIEYSGGLTSKQLKLIEMVSAQIEDGQKVIVFSEHPEFVQLMSQQFDDHGVENVGIFGGVTIDERNKRIRLFRSSEDVSLLIATRGVAAKGFNLPQGDSVHSIDWCWTPSDMEQAEARILRPSWMTAERVATGQKPQLYRHVLSGSIDEYMRQLILAKADGYGEAIDHNSAQHSDEAWQTVREFAENMLRDLGYLEVG